MKQIFTLSVLAGLLFQSVFFSGCNPSTGSKSDKSEKSVATSDTFCLQDVKEQVVGLVMEMNEAEDIVPLLNKAGASYISDLTVPIELAEKQMTEFDQSLFWGMVVFDMIYAKTYNRTDVLAKVSDLEYKFKMELGLGEALKKVEGYQKRIEANKDNKDSLEVLFDEAMNIWFSELAENHLNVLVYSTLGNTVEALYVTTQLTLLATDNSELLALVNKQHGQVAKFFSLLKLIRNDENVKPYYDDLEHVAATFSKNETINEALLKDIAGKIEKVRNGMVD
ncbi:MAG: hypothetical protein K9H26_03050 [Prolixibacteraceae bacterium]|nr:hypothetical protein [Prolixibacteraceae bacterium]